MQPQLVTPSLARHQPTTRRGFNLVEAAIVLGVVGLVIGGIWVVAGDIQQKRRVTDFYSASLKMVDDVRRLYSGLPVSAGLSNIGPAMWSAGVFPSNVFVQNTGAFSGTYPAIMAAWSARTSMSTGTTSTTMLPIIRLYMTSMKNSKSDCIQLLTMYAQTLNSSRLVAVIINGATIVYNLEDEFGSIDTTLSLDEASTSCVKNMGVLELWFYK